MSKTPFQPMTSNALLVEFTDEERCVIDQLCAKHEMRPQRLLIQALRTYQLVDQMHDAHNANPQLTLEKVIASFGNNGPSDSGGLT